MRASGKNSRSVSIFGLKAGFLATKYFFPVAIHVSLQHGFIEPHDAAFMLRRDGFIEMLVIREFVHEGKEKTDPEGIPNMEENIFVFLRLEEGNRMDFDLPKRAPIERV